jgi:hypothetical protein
MKTNQAVAALASIGAIDIGSFDAVAVSAAGHEFELIGLDGVTGTGVFVTVQGKHADEVFKWMSATVGKATLEMQIAQRKNKPMPTKSMEDLRSQNIEGATIRVIGWRGVKQDFDRALLKAALGRNPHWIDQIVEESDNMGNFTPAESNSSPTTPEKSSE